MSFTFQQPDTEANLVLLDGASGRSGIKGATLEKLVERLTHPGYPGTRFLQLADALRC